VGYTPFITIRQFKAFVHKLLIRAIWNEFAKFNRAEGFQVERRLAPRRHFRQRSWRSIGIRRVQPN
jgi:hypothetical protein